MPAAFSHCEGNKAPRVAVQSRGPGSTRREVAYLQLGSPANVLRTTRGIYSGQGAYADNWLTILCLLIIIIIKRRSGINPIPPTVIDWD